eukprot:TRINITY_DN11087_c0_g1_i1.p1 TRINITY_DN11087_c0_g1~~TRINITY_DN11087_c0_g1_i1.p1  ORF type:complete len:212 (-),score=53.04 TRINITY_DN11087_c0_g1_i1:192-827(-)
MDTIKPDPAAAGAGDLANDDSPLGKVKEYQALAGRIFQSYLDFSMPHLVPRWGFTAVSFIIYWLRVWYGQGWYIVTYALGLYLLNLLIGFLTPLADPETDDSPTLPVKSGDEFKPFIRRLPEFKFWYSFTKAVWIAFACTLTRATDWPVFWPILLVYFIVLFFATMKKQIMHMIKYQYLPFTTGKKKYTASASSAAAAPAGAKEAPKASKD